jgi:VanZ family protein
MRSWVQVPLARFFIQNMKNIIKIILFILCLGTIFYFSSLPASEIDYDFVATHDYLFHFAEYFVLAFLGFSMMKIKPSIFWQIFIIVFLILWSISDEYHQSFVPGRDASLRDLLVDWLAIVVGGWFYLRVWTRIKKMKGRI